jgi:hypothetical protein
MVCLPNNPSGQKCLNKKVTNQSKPRYLTQKQNQLGWLKNTGSTLNQIENHDLTWNPWFDHKPNQRLLAWLEKQTKT